MAGAFKGNDDDEELDEQDEETEQNEDEQDENAEENDDESESEDSEKYGLEIEDEDEVGFVGEKGLTPWQRKIFRQREAILKNKLTKIKTDLARDVKRRLNLKDETTLKEAREHKKLKRDVKQIELALKAKKVKRTFTIVQSLSVPMLWVLLGLLIIFAAIFLLAVVVIALGSIGIPPFRDWIEEILGPGRFEELQQEASLGIKGDKFFGTRAIYKDDEKATIEILTNYIDLVKEGTSIATGFEESYTIGEGTEAKTYQIKNVSVDINLDVDFNDFNETTFATENPVLYEYLMNLAGEMFEVDNDDETPETLLDRALGIKYFGLNEVVLSHAISEIISIVENNINFEIYLNEAKEENSELFEVVKPMVLDDIDPQIETVLNTQENKIRTQKLFIKDVVFKDGDNSKTEGVLDKQNYVAIIFMPKQDVTFKQFSFLVIDNADVEMKLINGQTDLGLHFDSTFMTKQDTKTDTSEGVDIYYYCTNDLNISVPKFENIDEDNKSILKDGVSLFELIKTNDNFEKYLEITTIDENEIYDYKRGGITLEINSSVPFAIKEYETKYD